MKNIVDDIIIRKINSLLVIIIIVLLLWHGLFSVLYMLGLVNYTPDMVTTGRRLFLFVMLHMIFSLYLYFKNKYRRIKIKTYFNIQNKTLVQAFSGMGILIFMFLHYISYSMIPINPNLPFIVSLIHIIIDTLLFTMICLHLTISIPRMLISFGFLSKDKIYDNFENNTKNLLIIVLVLFFLIELTFYII